MLLCIPLGAVYRAVLHPKRVSPQLRLVVSLVWGLLIGWICFASELIILIVVSTLCYGLTWSVNPKEVHKVVFVVSFSLLLVAQIARMIMEYGDNKFDYTGRLMIITQKVTYLAFSVHDGLGRKEDELTKDQKEQSIKRVPSLLEYFGYTFHHSMLLAGPACTFNDYIDFIEGRDIARATEQKMRQEPSPVNAVLTKLSFSLLCMVLFAFLSKILPFYLNADPYFIANSSFLWRIAFVSLSMMVVRLKFYFAWTVADAGNNACGLGFNGYDSNGRELWNRITNVNALEVEKATSIRHMVNNWNIQTNIWLKRLIYERVPYQKTFFTLAASCIWHGIYPGYLLTVTSAGMLMVVSKKARRTYGHVFRDMSPIKTRLFDFLLWLVCNAFLITYCFVSFVFLRLDLAFTFYRSTYFIGHILLIGGLIIFSVERPKPSHEAKNADVSVTSQHSSKPEIHTNVPLPSAANNNALHRDNRKLK